MTYPSSSPIYHQCSKMTMSLMTGGKLIWVKEAKSLLLRCKYFVEF